MMIKLFIISFWAFASFVRSADAGDERAQRGYPKQGLGFAAGAISGIGLSYKHYLDDRYVTQGTFGLRKTQSEFDVDAGFVLQRTLHTTLLSGKSLEIGGLSLRTRFYGVTGLGYFRERNEWKEYDYGRPEPQLLVIHREVRTTYHTGLGIGMEFIIFQRVGIAIDGAYTFSFKSVNMTAYPRYNNGEEGLEIQFLPQIAAHYYF
ncbi:MAG: hypothetical protein HY709_03140 [Candidatus Latescibacteria bacterium]|nr:hypothetical protein [Candidatus Latescibacterota bacterium]